MLIPHGSHSFYNFDRYRAVFFYALFGLLYRAILNSTLLFWMSVSINYRENNFLFGGKQNE